jgi:AAA domain
MAILDIRPAVRGESKAIIGIAGPSGSGKTLTSLLIARGMVGNASEIGLLDTENKRGSHYANSLDGKFMIGDLYPPFSPKRYSEALKEFQVAGVKVLVIDSVSHEWEGEGGCDDIANALKADGTERKIANWIGAKREHKNFMNTLLQCNMHIICCIRAREKMDFKNILKPVSLGMQPICEKNFMFEMTASLLMENEGKKQTFLKIPEFLKQTFGDGNSYLGVDTGKNILKWVNEGEKENPEIAKIKSDMLMSCEFGVAGLMAIWNKLDIKMKKKLESHKNICKESAEEYERQQSQAEDTPQGVLKESISNKGALKIDLL